MHLSKPIRFDQVGSRVMAYDPPRFDLGIPDVALDLAQRSQQGSRFMISELTRQQTGLHQLEVESFEEKVENEAMARLKDVQEAAYKEAFDLGLVEGRQEAFQKASSIIDEKIKSLDELMSSIVKMKVELTAYNEAHLVQLTHHIAQRLAGHEISVSPEATLQIIRQATEIAQSEEEMTVLVAPEQLAFLEELRGQSKRELEFLKKLKLEPDPSVGLGGCVIRNNYGEIDSRFSERIDKIWETLKESLVRVKPELKSA